MKSVIFANMLCKVVPSVSYNLQQQQQQLINNGNKNRILIVDGDNQDNHTTLKLDLERNGFIVDTFKDPLVALDNFRPGLFDMVVIDKRMSKMKLVYLHSSFKKIDDKVRICILSPSETY
ncbi:MAG: response regulator [Candidatus Nitrosopolaris sp.]